MLVGYVRISTSDDRQSTDLQRDALHAAGVDGRNIYEDRASGARDDRLQLKACLDYLKGGDVLVVWKLDRLGRSLRHLMELIHELRERDVGFRTLTESFDTTTPGGELLFHIFGAMAQYERALITERINAGLAAARQRGRVGGRPRLLDQGKLNAARLLLGQDKSLSEVARTMSVSRSTLADALKRERSHQ